MICVVLWTLPTEDRSVAWHSFVKLSISPPKPGLSGSPNLRIFVPQLFHICQHEMLHHDHCSWFYTHPSRLY